jgi:chemotaxis protein CheD
MSVNAIGIGEMLVTRNREDIIKTYALGSCVAVMIYDKDGIGGMVHIALPDSSIIEDADNKPPGYFADKALPALIEKMKRFGSSLKKIWIKIAGGSDSNYENDNFNIGKRNILAVKKFLWKNGLGIISEETGGKISRTIELHLNDGTIMVSSNGNKWTI